MIHIIPHHINRGSWIPWYNLIHFDETEELNYYKIDNPLLYEHYHITQEEFPSHLKQHLNVINPKEGDFVFCDIQYFPYWNHALFFDAIEELAKKYKIKFFIVDTDNFVPYSNTEYYTIFSNRFTLDDTNVNFNYFRYRPAKELYFNSIPTLFNPFLYTMRHKKGNFIVGVDKVERLLTLKHIFDINLNNDLYVGYSGFSKAYDDSEISDKLKEFRDATLPIILDTTFEKSCNGAVNVEYPPFPSTLNSYVSIICETSVSMDSIHLSEKAWNPFISMNIPLVLGSSGINLYLKEMGFWLADDLFDLSIKTNYIDIVNQYKSNLNIIHNMSYSELYEYFQHNKDKFLFNHELLGRQKFIFNRNNYK